jgi:hypothetical protein
VFKESDSARKLANIGCQNFVQTEIIFMEEISEVLDPEHSVVVL